MEFRRKNITEIGLNLIKKYEGFYALPYRCPADLLTIGYGHVIQKHESFKTMISVEEALNLLKQDVGVAERAVNRTIAYPVNDNQFDALVSFTFNLGTGQLQRSTLRMKLNRGDVEGTAKEFLKYVFAGGRKLKGLVLRRQEESLLFMA